MFVLSYILSKWLDQPAFDVICWESCPLKDDVVINKLVLSRHNTYSIVYVSVIACYIVYVSVIACSNCLCFSYTCYIVYVSAIACHIDYVSVIDCLISWNIPIFCTTAYSSLVWLTAALPMTRSHLLLGAKNQHQSTLGRPTGALFPVNKCHKLKMLIAAVIGEVNTFATPRL